MSALGPADEYLAAALAKLEADAAGGRFNTFVLRDFAEIALLVGAEDFSARALALLRRAPDRSFTAGILTNAPFPTDYPDRVRRLSPLAELERRHPRHDPAAFPDRLRAQSDPNGPNGLALAGRTADAVRAAGRGLALEEVGITLAVMGDFAAAFAVAANPNLEPFRGRNVRFVVALELFMAGRAVEARAVLAELAPGGLGDWELLQVVRALAGREPWGGYPYPDW